jgi:hypothetical protein
LKQEDDAEEEHSARTRARESSDKFGHTNRVILRECGKSTKRVSLL